MLGKKSEVNISLSLPIFYHKLFMVGPTEMDSISMISSYFFYNKTVDFKFSAYDTFLEYPSLGILKIERLAKYHQKIV